MTKLVLSLEVFFRKQESIRDLSYRYFFVCLCILGTEDTCLKMIEKLISTAAELYQTLSSISGFCSLMKVFTSNLVVDSKNFRRFKTEYISSKVLKNIHRIFCIIFKLVSKFNWSEGFIFLNFGVVVSHLLSFIVACVSICSPHRHRINSYYSRYG